MEEQKNFYERIKDFVLWHWENIKENVTGFKEAENKHELFKCCIYALISSAVLIACAFVSLWLLKNVLSIVVSVMTFLNREENKAIAILIKGLVVIYSIALVINLLTRKESRDKTEREQDAERTTLARDLFPVIKKLAGDCGVKRPETLSDLYSFDLAPFELVSGVYIYVFTVEKTLGTDKSFESSSFKMSLIRTLKRMERANELSVACPYGYIKDDKLLSAILIFDVEDCGDYIEIKVARADDDSYSLYKNRINEAKIHKPVDPDFSHD
jgi:hypothetical protein